MTSTTIMSSVDLSKVSGNFASPASLALQATTTAVQLIIKLALTSFPEGKAQIGVWVGTCPDALTASSVDAKALAPCSDEVLCTCRDVGVTRYFKSEVLVAGGGNLLAWLEVPSGLTGTITVTAVET